MPQAQLDAALQRLESALSEFRAAYEAWLRAADDGADERLRRLIEDAEQRLDEARQALLRVEAER